MNKWFFIIVLLITTPCYAQFGDFNDFGPTHSNQIFNDTSKFLSPLSASDVTVQTALQTLASQSVGGSTSYCDDDGDTCVHVEESADEDKVRIDVGAQENALIIDSSSFQISDKTIIQGELRAKSIQETDQINAPDGSIIMGDFPSGVSITHSAEGSYLLGDFSAIDTVTVSGEGSMLIGSTQSQLTGSTYTVSGDGILAIGSADSGGQIIGSGTGCIAAGRADGNSSGTTEVKCSGQGSAAFGYALGSGVGSTGSIRATSTGSFAAGDGFGLAGFEGSVAAEGAGCIALGAGIASSSDAKVNCQILSTGGIVMGFGSNGNIITDDAGGINIGAAVNNDKVNTGTYSIIIGTAIGSDFTMSGDRSVAIGSDLVVTSNDSVSLGSGFTNSTNDSLAIGFSATPIIEATNTDLDVNGSATFNDGQGDFDFQVEGDTIDDLIYADASTDRVGIGTTAPAARLTVDKAAGSGYVLTGTNGTQNAGLYQATGFSSWGSINSGDDWKFFVDNNSGLGLYIMNSTGNVAVGGSEAGNPTETNLTLDIRSDGTNGWFGASTALGSIGDVFIIDENENVGIGTNTPSEKLHTFSTANNFLEIETSFNQAGFLVSNSTNTWRASIDASNNFTFRDDTNGNDIFTLFSGAPSSAFRVRANGITDFNSENANQDFHVASTARDTFFRIDANQEEAGFGNTSANVGHLFTLTGVADEEQLFVIGNATQTSDLIVAEQSGGTDVFNLDNSGNLTILGDLTIADGQQINLEGEAGNTYLIRENNGSDDVVSLYLDGVKVREFGPLGDILLGDTTLRVMRPADDGKIDLGTSSFEFNDFHLKGDADIDGTSNLDIVDIDGTLTVDGTDIDFNPTSEFRIDGALTDFGGGTYTVANGDNDVGIDGDLEVNNDVHVAGENQGTARTLSSALSITGISSDQYMTVSGVTMTANKGFVMERAGSIVGLSIAYNVTTVDVAALGGIDIQVRKNGTNVYSTGELLELTNGDKKVNITQNRGTDTFIAGDTISLYIDQAVSGSMGTTKYNNFIATVSFYYDT